jgi:malate dehydrogenase
MSKVSIIGAGNVGATAARNLARDGMIEEIVLLDIKEGVAEGKAADIMQSLMMKENIDTIVTGTTGDYTKTADSRIIVITSGVPRKPGMTREELVGVNSKVVKSVLEQTTKYSPDAIYVVVSNPMDTMTQLVVNYLGVENAHRVIGMGGLLDSARFKYNIFMKLQEKHPDTFSPDEIYAKVIGGHGDTTMVPLTNTATVFGNPLKSYFTDEEIADIVDKTMRGGAILTKALGTSAWEAPAMGIYDTVNKLLGDEGYDLEMFPASVYRKEYGLCIGSIINVNYDGVTEIFLDETTDPVINEKFIKSVEAVRAVNEAL